MIDRFLLDLVHFLGHGMGHQPWALLPRKRKVFNSDLGPGRNVSFLKDTAEGCGVKCCTDHGSAGPATRRRRFSLIKGLMGKMENGPAWVSLCG